MNKYKNKIKQKIDARENNEKTRQDIYSATEFKKGLDKGELEIGSLLFSGLPREEFIIKKICSYLGLSYLGKESITCGWPDCNNSFEVIHYKVGI